MNCYFSRNYKEFNAGNKAKTDVERIMADMGFCNIGNKATFHEGKIRSYFLTLGSVLKAVSRLKKGDVLVLQYPLKKYYEYVCRKAHKRGAKVVTLIHDLGSFRRKKLTVEQEMERLSHSDYIIATNESMKGWLAEEGYKGLLGSLDVWDYFSVSTPLERSVHEVSRVVYAGSLNRRKNEFLYQIERYIQNYKLVLYGKGFEMEAIRRKDQIEYKGFVASDRLIAETDGDYGLVWDGSSVDECVGGFGEYLRYNTPHKVSLYLCCELPVIIWDQAALAGFIRENNAGICIASLTDLDDVLSKITPEEYAVMKENVRRISRRISEGYYFKRAVTKAIEELAAQ